MSRQRQEAPAKVVDTEAGTVTLRAYSATEISVDGASMTFNRISYHLSMALERSCGDWPWRFKYYALSRVGSWNDATEAARKKARELTLKLATDWLAEEPDLLRRAELARINNEILRNLGKLEELRAEVTKTNRALEAQEAAITLGAVDAKEVLA